PKPTTYGSASYQGTAAERGYRTGYSDGYPAGLLDVTNTLARVYWNKEHYLKAVRGFNDAYGSREDFRDGYQQGFEIGYKDGYERRPFASVIPTGLTRRGTVP
ncbi:MAG: hypothetical protein M3R69_16870, partial [Acidobacteriota bacterium]|nr:hypothetical protein [Acidobacteriota bacterium]